MNFATLFEEKQYEFISQYFGMVNTIQEALNYLEPCLSDLAAEEAEFIISEIHLSLEQLAESNTLLNRVFYEQEGILDALAQFDDLIEYMWMMDDHSGDSTVIKGVLQELMPVFSKWKSTIESEFIPYLSH
ncbi:hypothetical protein [Rossellomorea vietnamensis]|uniref:hypothetical protein n=1 Tax=Rossellomorea vietnamensis TaxID=218284 RepID=UPI001E2A0BC0|nr:hypothetical protein [Rossellomorea vietnamensis]MCC5802142.1 hypothetical protein [Rossellomorea vietnamensis]